MVLDSAAGRLVTGLGRRGLTLSIVGTLVAALTMAIASPAQASAPNTAKAWGANSAGQLGDGTEAGPEKCGAPSQTACSTTPVAVTGLSGVSALAGGPMDPFSRVGVALLEGGTVSQWGERIGDVPVAVCAVGASHEECPSGPFLNGAMAVSVGELHAL